VGERDRLPRKPDFFIVGAPRCGTTSLYEYLKQHPDVYMSASKELHFFGTDIRYPQAANMVRGENEYLSMFHGATNEKRIGEASPLYLYSKAAARELKSSCPNALLIIMLRNPVDMMYSNFVERRYYGNYLAGQEDIEDFEEALRAEEARKRGQRIPRGAPPFPPGPFYLFYRDLAQYAEQVRRYLAVFDREQLHFVIFDDLQQDALKVFSEVCRFLGIDPGFKPKIRVANPQKKARSRLLMRFILNPSPALLRLGRVLMPQRIRRPLGRLLVRTAATTAPPPPIDPDLRRRLQQEFRAEVEELSRLVNRDLTHWVGEPTHSSDS
jgi:hypothetical protein